MTLPVPFSSVTGIGWPAIPSPALSPILSTQYQFERSEWLSAPELAALQWRQLSPLIAHSRASVPFYADRLAPLDRPDPLIPRWQDWQAVPLLTRADLQSAGDTILTRALPTTHGEATDQSTSGSTGQPVRIKSTAVVGLMFSALNLRSHFWHGRDFAATVCGIRSLTPPQRKAASENKALGWTPGYPSGPMYFLDISRPLGEQIDWLQAKNPQYLLTNPSNLQALIDETTERGIRFERLREVVTMGETLDPATLDACERIWEVPVRDIYSATEMGIMALTCPQHGHYHVQSECVLIEVLDDDGRPCGPGEIGRVVATSLHNFATPLIRYDIGDYAEVGAPCPCGRGLPVLKRIMGRVRNMAVLPNGEKFWPNMPPGRYMDVAPIRQIQVVQTSLENMEIRLATARPLTTDEEGALRQVFTELFHHPFDFRFTYVDSIPRDAGGKFEGFVSRIVQTA